MQPAAVLLCPAKLGLVAEEKWDRNDVHGAPGSPPQDVAAIAEELGVTEAAVAARRLVKYFEIVEWIVSMNLPQGTTYVWDCVGNSQ